MGSHPAPRPPFGPGPGSGHPSPPGGPGPPRRHVTVPAGTAPWQHRAYPLLQSPLHGLAARAWPGPRAPSAFALLSQSNNPRTVGSTGAGEGRLLVARG